MATTYEEINGLIENRAPLRDWIDHAIQEYRNGDNDTFYNILEEAMNHKFHPYPDFDQEYMLLLDTLAAYNVQLGYRQRVPEKRRDYFKRATQIYTNADKIIMYDEVFHCLQSNKCLINT